MPWKTVKIGEDDKAQDVIAIGNNGDPVWIDDDSSEIAVDWPRAKKRINELMTGEKSWRQKHKETEDGFNAFKERFKNIEDPEAAFQALEKLKKIDVKKLIDAGEVDKVKDEIRKIYDEKLISADQKIKEIQGILDKTIKEKDAEIYRLIVSNRFASSPFIKEKTLLLPDFAENYFGKNFRVEDGKPVGYYTNGDKIYSKAKPGDSANFEEALEILVNQHPNKDHIFKGTQMSGGGMQGSSGGAQKTYRTLSDFTTMQEKLDFIAQKGQDEYQKIVDASISGRK